jgi:hypothetical protein
MPTNRGINVKLEIALTFSAAKVVTAITKAAPGVATSAAHGLTDGMVGFWTITDGMVELHEQATRVKNSATNAFDLQSLDTTTYSTFTTGTFTPAATWATLSEAVGYSIGGGSANQLDDTRLLDTKTRNVNGLLGAQNVTIDVRNQTFNSAIMDKIETAARTQVNQLYRVTLFDGSSRVFYGMPSMPGENLASGQLASGQFGVTVPQWVLKGAA